METIYKFLASSFMPVFNAGLIPDAIIRPVARMGIRGRIDEIMAGDVAERADRKTEFVQGLKTMPVAVNTADANTQHYEIPTEYYDICLGKRKKYSCCYWGEDTKTLEEAETLSLKIVCERAGIEDGMAVLDLGCGWGSLTLYLAEHYSKCRITSLSNSRTQREYIESICRERGFKNVRVITADIRDYDGAEDGLSATFDRVMSIEMFEHMKNYQVLTQRISSWLKAEGKLFVHIFVHREMPYHFVVRDQGDWMSKYFFTGGTMPSNDLLHFFQDHLALQQQWSWNGVHYSKTLEAWLARVDSNLPEVKRLLASTYGKDDVTKWLNYHRLFFIACSELFALNQGNEYFVSNYLFANRPQRS